MLHITGCLEFSDPVRTVSNCFGHALRSAIEHNLEHEVLTGEEVNKRFPGWRLPSHFKVTFCPTQWFITHCFCCATVTSDRTFSQHITRLAATLITQPVFGFTLTSWKLLKFCVCMSGRSEGHKAVCLVYSGLLEGSHSRKASFAAPQNTARSGECHSSYLCHTLDRIWRGLISN